MVIYLVIQYIETSTAIYDMTFYAYLDKTNADARVAEGTAAGGVGEHWEVNELITFEDVLS